MSKKNRSTASLIEVLTRLAEQRALWQPLIKFDPVSRHYARLASEHDFEAWLLTWVPGQGTVAVSRHVYSPALVEMNAYQVNAGGLLQLADSQLVGRNW
jgi:hypothetical protein